MASPANSVSNPRRFLKFAKYESAMNDVISAIRKFHFGKSIDEDFLQSLKMLTENKMVAADVIKRPESIMDNALLRFPHLGESIFEELDNESLAKSREVCDFWKIFIDDQKLPWIRMIKRHIKFLDPWQELIKISSVETLQEMACTVHQYYIENDIKCPQGTKITYLDCPRNPYKRASEYWRNENTPLHFASMCGNLGVIEILLKNPKSEYWKCQNGLSPLHFAAKSGHLEAYKLIAKYSDDKNPKSDSSEYMGLEHAKELEFTTPLHLAAEYGHLTICQFIVANVGDKNPKCWLKCTPFHSAAMQGHLEICRLLIENSTDKNPVGAAAYTPLHWAAERGHLAVCQLIIENIGHYINTDDLNKSPFELAAENGHESVCRFLKDVVSRSGRYKGPGSGYIGTSEEEDYDDDYSDEESSVAKSEAAENYRLPNDDRDEGCPNKQNRFHECTAYCDERWTPRNYDKDQGDKLLGASSDAKTPGFSINTSTGDRLARSYFKPLKEPTYTKKARLDYEKKRAEKKITDMSSAFGFEEEDE